MRTIEQDDPLLRDYLSPRAAAAMIGVHTKTLEHWRQDGQGPAYSRHSNRVLYRRADVEQYIRARAPR